MRDDLSSGQTGPLEIRLGFSARSVLAATALALLVFFLWPQLDLRVAALFFGPGEFAAEHSATLQAVRIVIWRSSNALFLLALASVLYLLLTGKVTGGTVGGISAKVWSFIICLYLIGPGLLVDLVLKPLWARPRPHYLDVFGGDMAFASVFEPLGTCVRNCSFVSGEVSGATVLAVSLIVLFNARWGSASRGARTLVIAAVCLLPFLAGLQRIATGRHFLSDAVFSVLFHLMLALVLRELFLGGWRKKLRRTIIDGLPVQTEPARSSWVARESDPP